MQKLLYTFCISLFISSVSLFAIDYEVRGAIADEINGINLVNLTNNEKFRYPAGLFNCLRWRKEFVYVEECSIIRIYNYHEDNYLKTFRNMDRT